MFKFKGYGGMHDFGGGIPWRGHKLLFMVCFCILHHLTLVSSEPSASDTDDFKNLRLNTNTYVDRSLQIEDFLFGRGCCSIVLRPKGWGKTVNLKMLQRFFDVETSPNGTILAEDQKQNSILFTGGELNSEGNKKILEPLKIAANKAIMKKQGTHPVIYLNLTGIDGTTYKDFQDGVKARVLDVFYQFEWMRSSPNFSAFDTIYMKKYLEGRIYSANIIVSINFLSRCLYRHFGEKVMVFVDDYDAPVINAYQRLRHEKPQEYFQVYYFLRSLYVQSFHLNECIEKGLLSGMIKLHLLRVVYFYSFLDRKYSNYYGFHQQDLDQLLANVSFTPDREKIKDWYGYKYNESVQLYHPGSIIRFIENKGAFDYYWLDPKNTGIDEILLSDDLQDHLSKFSKGESFSYFANLTDVSNFEYFKPLNQHVFLLYTGFLTPVNGKWSQNDQHELVPANSQVKHLLQIKVREWEAVKANVTKVSPQNDTLEGKLEQFETTLQQNVGLIEENNTSLIRNVSETLINQH